MRYLQRLDVVGKAPPKNAGPMPWVHPSGKTVDPERGDGVGSDHSTDEGVPWVPAGAGPMSGELHVAYDLRRPPWRDLDPETFAVTTLEAVTLGRGHPDHMNV